MASPFTACLPRLCFVTLAVCALLSSACGSSLADRQREQVAIRRESSPQELLKRGEAAAALGDLTRAEQYYVAALRGGADAKLITQRLLRVCVADQRFPVAADYAEQYLSRHPNDSEVAFAAAAIHAALGETERARQLLEGLMREQPAWAEAHYALASVLRAGGDPSDLADRHDLEYLKLDPRGPFAEAARARLARRSP